MYNSKISIIIPVYNAEKHINKCIESIINQTYKNLEIICINDGSIDSSLDILETFAKHDDRIKVINTENHGASIARNIGLDNVTGDYIMFVDSDDWIELNTCQIALDTLIKHNVDIVMWDYYSESKNLSSPKNIFDNDVFFDKSDVINNIHRRMFGPVDFELSKPQNIDSLCTLWGKLYKSEYILKNNIKLYDIKKIGSFEDGLFNISALEYVDSAYYLHKQLYHYRKNSTSITNTYRACLRQQHEHMFNYLDNYIVEHQLSDTYRKALNNRIVLDLIGNGLNIMLLPESRIKSIKSILNDSKYLDAFNNLNFKYLPLHWKIFFFCAKLRFAFGVFLLLLCIKKLIGR